MDRNTTKDHLHFNKIIHNTTELQDPRVLATSFLLYKIGEAINQVYFPILLPVGIIGNILSFLVMIQPNNRHMSFSAYISALAVSDTTVLLNALSRYLNLVHHVDMPPSQFRYCSLLVMFVFSSIQCSAYLIVAMTFERFYSIIQPHKAASFNTVKKARIVIIWIFVFNFSFYIPLLFVGNNDGRNCIPNRFASGNVYGAIYYWTSELIGFILPFVLLLTMNSVIIHTLRQRSKLNLMSTEGQGQSEGQISKNKNSEKQVYSILLFVTFSYFTLTIPGKVLIFYLNFYRGNTAQYYAGLHLLDQVGGKLYYTNHGINFFLYVMSGQKFRTDLRNLFALKKTTTNSTSIMSHLNTISSTLDN